MPHRQCHAHSPHRDLACEPADMGRYQRGWTIYYSIYIILSSNTSRVCLVQNTKPEAAAERGFILSLADSSSQLGFALEDWGIRNVSYKNQDNQACPIFVSMAVHVMEAIQRVPGLETDWLIAS